MSNYRHITPGGCGSHWLGRFMRDCYNARFPAGWNGHRRNPDLNAAPENRIIYLTADPFDTILSFDRRGFLKNKKHCQNMQGNVELMDKINHHGGMNGLIKFGEDPFKLEDHIDQWMGFDRRTYDLMIVKYENLLYHIKDVLDFFELDSGNDRITRFQNSHVSRRSKWEQVDEKTKRGIEDIYGEYRNKWLALDSKILFKRSG